MMIKIFLWACIIWLLPLLYVTQRNEAKFKKNIVIGTTLPKEAQDDEDVKAILEKYKKDTKTVSIILGLAVIPAVLPKGFTWLLFFWCLWLDAIIVVLQIPFVKANKKLRALKKEKGWAKKPEEQETVIVNTGDISMPKWISPWVFILTLLVSLVPIIIKPSIWYIIVINAFGQLLFYLCYRYCFRTKSEMVDGNVELTRALTQVRRCYWSRFWVKCAAATAVESFALLLIGESNGWFLVLLTLYTVYIAAASFKQEIKIRNIQERFTVDCGVGDYIDDDDKWLWGMFYCNKNDSHAFVNARVGMGTTVNVAKPVGKFIMIIGIVCLIGLLPFPFLMDVAIDSEIDYAVEGSWVVVSCGREDWRFEPSKIESVEILEEYPEKLSRTWGTATEKVLKGTFSATGIPSLQVALNPGEPPYLLIKTNANKYYLFGLGDRDKTMELYRSLEGQ